jgi:hypothetical protein
MKRSPGLERLPWESLRWMTGPRSARSAALFVGSAPSTLTNVQSAGQSLGSLLAEQAVEAGARALAFGPLEQLAQLALDRLHLACEPLAVLVFLVGVPALERAPGQGEAGLSELLLLG